MAIFALVMAVITDTWFTACKPETFSAIVHLCTPK
jgi:hypothetical protein